MVTQTIALEYAKHGIRLNGIAPGAIETPINAEKLADPEQKKSTLDLIPINYIGKAEKNTAEQIKMCFKAASDQNWIAQVD